jgi:4-diphosphocytidyl-2-C-methyl-D-erythritol kinase
MNHTRKLHVVPKKSSHNHVYTITRARRKDLPRLAAIEFAAAELLTGHAPDSILKENTSPEELRHAQSHGHLWVALVKDVPVGFAHVEILEPFVDHLKEIDVDPEPGRRGIGAKLVMTICEWAHSAGYAFLTLTTFGDIPWNMPFYAKPGFLEIDSEELSSPLRPVVEDEARRGLDRAHRVVMRRSCAAWKAIATATPWRVRHRLLGCRLRCS